MSLHRPSPPDIPDHQLLHPIGKGSYGEVWLARNVLGTFRAVKVVRRDAFSEARPFEREFAGIQRFEPISRTHEGLVDVLQVGRNESEGIFYYVMELADPVAVAGDGVAGGPPIDPSRYQPRSIASDLTSRQRLSAAECLPLFHGLALALAHLHRTGLVHRDIKPSNIVFVGGMAKFADIGLVTWADDSLSYVGTAGYIPPEGAGTVAGDLYGLGKVLYECATGRDRNDFPVLPPDLVDSAAGEGLLELNAIWLKACATSPAERYRSAEDLAADLALLQAGRSVKRLRVIESRLRRARRLSGAVAVTALVALAGMVVIRREASFEKTSRLHEQQLRQRAEQAERAAQQELGEARIAQARALLQSQQIGRASAALALLTNPVNPRLRIEARSLAATALALPDLSPDTSPESAHGPPATRRIVPQPDGGIRVEGDGTPANPVVLIPPQGEHEPVRDPLLLSDDGRFLYAGYGRYTERIWDLRTGAKVAELDTNYFVLAFRPGRPEAMVSYTNGDLVLHRLPGWEVAAQWRNKAAEGPLEWSPDGGTMVFPNRQGDLEALRMASGEFLALGAIRATVTSDAWHPDGRRFAVASDDGYVRVRDLDAWGDYMILARHEARIIRTMFLPPFPWLLTSSWDGTSKLWDWQSGHELGRLGATGYEMNYDDRSRTLRWRLGSEPHARAWRLHGGRLWRELFFGNPRVIGGPFMASFSADNQWLAAPDSDGIRLWHVPTLAEALRIPGYSQSAWLGSDGRELVAVQQGEVRRWRLVPGEGAALRAEAMPSLGRAADGTRVAATPDLRVVAHLQGDRVTVWSGGDSPARWKHGQELAETLAMSPDGRWLAIGTRNHIGARVFDPRTGKVAWQTALRHGTHPAFSADSRWLAVGTDEGCHVFDAATGAVRWSRPKDPGVDPTFWEVAFSPDGSLLAWTPKPYRLQLLDAASGAEILTLDYPTPRFITGLQFSPDGQWLAEPSNKHALMLWDLGALRQELDHLGLGWR